MQKTGSQWIRGIFSDPRVCDLIGFQPYVYESEFSTGLDPRKLKDRWFDNPFPIHTIATTLYIPFESFLALPKPENYKAFFIMRDPRDIVISWYFSVLHSHPLIGEVPDYRIKLSPLSQTEGILAAIEILQDWDIFGVLSSWSEATQRDKNVLLVKFEDLIGSKSLDTFKNIFSHCEIPVTEKFLQELLTDYSFERLSGGRKQGEENLSNHLRKGVSGDWKNYFNDTIQQKFAQVTGDLLERLGYENSNDDFQADLHPIFHQNQVVSNFLMSSPQFLNRLVGCVNLYQIDPSDLTVLAELREIRRQIAEFWVNAPTEQLENFYRGDIGEGYRCLLKSGIHQHPLTEVEQKFYAEFTQEITQVATNSKSINYLLAAQLYQRSDRLPVSVNLEKIPHWLNLV